MTQDDAMPHCPVKPHEFETGVYRPPSEGGSASLLVRLTRNCPWNHCTFCAMYKSEKFELRPLEEILEDIDAMHVICLPVKEISDRAGQCGFIPPAAFSQWLRKNPDISFHPGLSMLFNWMAAGGKTVFLQDADSLIMKTADMIQVLEYLKTCFPTIERITSYARSRTLVRKPLSDLERIRAAGLDRLHIGLETGDAALLKQVKKGATPEDHVNAGQKAMKAGFQVSEYWMPGLGGRGLSDSHAKNTARVLNKINPHYIRSRPFTPRPGTLLFEKASKHVLDLMTPRETLLEIRQTLAALTVTSRVCFDHSGNHWTDPTGRLLLSRSYEGYCFPEEKAHLLGIIDREIAGDS